MSRYNVDKKTFIIAAMVILLCLVSLTGATLALFTSETEDGKIGINATSGNVKIDIIDATDETVSLVGEVLDFVTPTGDGLVQFEPGAVYYTEGFRVKNNSSIPVNFIVYISEDDTVSADFSEAFEVWLTTDPTSREGMQQIQQFEGSLNLGETSDVLYLVFRMKESAGNEFQDRTFTGVGITVCAVQGNGYVTIDTDKGGN